MEIREGIKYGYGRNHSNFATIKQSLDNRNNFYAEFDSGGGCAEFSKKEWINDFKSGKLQLVEYPYEIGDWILNTHSINDCASGDIFQIVHINEHGLSLFHEKNLVNGKQNPSYFRPCFFEEIPKFKQKKVVKENYDYLIPILTELNTT